MYDGQSGFVKWFDWRKFHSEIMLIYWYSDIYT